MGKKRFVAVLLALMLIFTGIPVTSMAATAASGTDGNIQWSLSTTGTLTISGSGAMPDYSSSKLPPWDGKKSSITSIVIKSGVTTVGVYAFKDCSSLKTVNLPSTVTAIKGAAFIDCTSLESITIPGNVERIWSNAFYGCTGLKTLTISDGVKIINESAFQKCTSLKTVYIPDSVTTLYPLSFGGCTNISKFVIEGTPEIPASSVGSLSILEGNEMIKTAGPIGGEYDFEYAYTDSLPSFDAMKGLESITFPEGVRGTLLNRHCTSLKVLDIPEGITSALCTNCTALEKLVLPKSITSVPRVATCTGLKTIYYRGSEAEWQNVTKYDLTDSIEIVFNVTDCDIYGHADGTTKTENEVKVTCTEEGSYDSVVYCTACGVELSREKITVPATGHTEGTAKRENVVDPTCIEEGSYDSVVYCTACGIELSREKITVPATGHTKGTAKRENIVDSTCTEEGSYDSVIYCTVCDVEISREPKVIPASHTEGTAKNENEVDATCTEKGSYDSVVYCSECGVELSRVKEILPVLGHRASTYTANEIEPDCVNEGSYDIIYHCTVCGVDYRTITKTVPALGHTESDPVIENEMAPACTTEGSYDTVVYCSVCNDEISREPNIVPALGHTESDPVIENEITPTCVAEGSYDTVIYCSVCRGEISRETKPIDKEKHVFINYTNDYDLWKQVAYCDNDCGTKEEKSIVPDKTGTCGKDLTWEYVDDGVLRIIGSGSMYNYNLTDSAPWTNLYIEKVYLSEELTSIGAYAFEGFKDITQITIPDSVYQIERKAFSNSGLEELFIPAGVTDIGSGIVSGCTNLKSLEVAPENRYFASDNNNLYSNDKSTLYYYHCQTPGTAIILNTVESFMPDAFNKNVTAFNVEEGSQNYISQDGLIYSADGTTLYLCPPGKQGAVTIPEGVTNVDAGAFAYCDEVTEINFPKTVISVNQDIIIHKDVILRSYDGTEVKAFADKYGYTYESLGCLVHEFETEWTVDRKPTKYAEGEKSHHCTKCGARDSVTAYTWKQKQTEQHRNYTLKLIRNRIIGNSTDCDKNNTIYTSKTVSVYDNGGGAAKYKLCPSTTIPRSTETMSVSKGIIDRYSVIYTLEYDGLSEEIIFSIDKDGVAPDGRISFLMHDRNGYATFEAYMDLSKDGNYKNVKFSAIGRPNSELEARGTVILGLCLKQLDRVMSTDIGTYENHKYGIKDLGFSENKDDMHDWNDSTGECAVCGETYPVVVKTSSINSSYTYTGSAITPNLTVTLDGKSAVEGKDYTIEYINNKNVGTATIEISILGEYPRLITKTFKIVPKNTTKVTAKLYGYNDAKISWNKVSGASGYAVYYKKSTASKWTHIKNTTSTSLKKANLSDGAKYSFKVVSYKTVSGTKYYSSGKISSSIYTLKKLNKPVVKKGTSGKVKVSWKNISGESGYQISMSTSKSGIKVVSTYSTTKGTYKNISTKKGKYYYYRVRAYKTVDGNKICGPWSTYVRFKR